MLCSRHVPSSSDLIAVVEMIKVFGYIRSIRDGLCQSSKIEDCEAERLILSGEILVFADVALLVELEMRQTADPSKLY